MNYVAGACINGRLKEIVLIKKTKPEWQKNRYNFVGGKIEEGETPYQAMVREFQEETNCHIKEWKPFAELIDNGNHIFLFYTVDNPEIKTVTEEKVFWQNIQLLDYKDTVPNLSWLIPMVIDRLTNPHTFDNAVIIYNNKIGTNHK